MPQSSEPAPSTARALCWGAFALALTEIAYVLVFSAPSFDGVGERLSYVLTALALFAPPAALLGLIGLGLDVSLDGVAPRTRAVVLSLLGAPPCGYVGWAAFRGPSAQRITGHELYGALIAVAGIAAIYAAARVLPSLITRARAPGGFRRALIGVVALGVVGLHVADQRVLPRLYPFFHRGLEALGILVAAIAVPLFPARRSRSWVAIAGLVTAAILGAITASVVLVRQGALGTVLADRAPAAGTLARLYPRPPRRPAPMPTSDDLDRGRGLPPGPRLSSRDVVLITVDAWRADRLNASVTPNLEALAARGVRFEDAYTQVPHTSFAVASLLTGKQVYALSALGLDAASHETLAQVFRRERFKTAAFYPPAVFFIDHDRLAPLEKSAYGFEYVKYEYMEAQARTGQVIDYFERERPARSFVWVHYFEPHEPYEVHPGITAGTPGGTPVRSGLPDAEVRYEGEIRYADAAIGRLLEYLRRTRPGALIVLAADHGEEFGEHGGRYHGTTLFDEQVRVPLVFAPVSGPALGPRTVRGAVGLIDVAPTILTLLGVPSSARMRGRDLSPWMGAGDPPPSSRLGPVFAEIDRKKMVVDGDDKLVCDLSTGGCALYDRATDPGERRDVQAAAPAKLEHLRGLLDRFLVGESRFESRAEGPPGMKKLFERGRLGDASVAPALAAALVDLDPDASAEVLRLLVELPPDPGTRDALQRLEVDGEEGRLLLDLLRARLDDEPARARLRVALAADRARPDGDPRRMPGPTFARAALATGDLDFMASALDRTEERELVIALAEALARSRDPRALDPLLQALAPVRSRAEVVAAIQTLGDPRAVDALERWLPNDPYVPVRVAMVRALAALAPSRVGGLSALAMVEREGPVLAALCDALLPGKNEQFVDDRHLMLARPTLRGLYRYAEFWSSTKDEVITVLKSAGEASVVSVRVGRGPWQRDISIPKGKEAECVLVRPVPIAPAP